MRSDMAMELTDNYKTINLKHQIKRTDIIVDENLSKKIGKPVGKYITIESDIVRRGNNYRYSRLAEVLSLALSEYTSEVERVMVVGLGNPYLTADALGSKVLKQLNITRNFSSGETKEICGFCPNVLGVTGIESFEMIQGVTKKVNPELIIAVDSLASASYKRLASAFQICSSGITPGSGVSNHKQRLDTDSLGVKVISIGVPMVIYSSTIISEAIGDRENIENADEDLMNMIVTPKDIDVLVDDCASVISEALNLSLIG